MRLQDFLKVKKVRAIRDYGESLTKGKEYIISSVDYISVCDDEGDMVCLDSDLFEPVLDPAENPLQDIELTPEFEAVEPVLSDNSANTQDNGVNMQDTPKFKVGDKVYLFGTDYIEEITKIIGANVYLAGADFDASVSIKEICHATQENYERLQATFPHIKFEQPPKELKGDELVRAMLTKGIKNVLCLWGSGDKIIIDRLDYKGSLMSTNCHIVGGLTPIDWYTGEPLTESVLKD